MNQAPKDQKPIDTAAIPAAWKSAAPLTLVCFATPWSGHSLMMQSVIDRLGCEHGKCLHTVRVDLEKESGLANRFSVLKAPSLLLFCEGELVDSMVGIVPEHVLARRLSDLLNALELRAGS